MNETIVLDGNSLSIEQVIAVAFGTPGQPKVEISEPAKQLVERAARAVKKMVAEGRIAYGITTGFGALKDRLIPPEQVEQLQRNILVSHSVGTGQPFNIATTRAIML